jgi:hypothetical protein
MKILNHPFTVALGISTLCLLFLIGPLVSPNHSAIYHLIGPAGPVFFSARIYFCYLWMLISGILLIAERFRTTWLPVWLGIILFVPWIVLKLHHARGLGRNPPGYGLSLSPNPCCISGTIAFSMESSATNSKPARNLRHGPSNSAKDRAPF